MTLPQILTTASIDQPLGPLGVVHHDTVLTGDGTSAVPLAIPASTPSSPGTMSALDKAKLDNWSSATRDFTGFSDPRNIITTYDSTARTVTLTGPVEAFWHGDIVPELVSGWVSPPHDTSTGPHFLYYDGSSYVWSASAWTFDMLQIAYAYYGATNKFSIRETHGLMPWQAHEEFHRTVGTYYETGGDIGAVVLGSTTVADRRPTVTTVTVHDEDLTTDIPPKIAGSYTQEYLAGSSVNTFTTGAADIVPLSGSQPYYNLNTAGSWSQALLPNNAYMCVWLVAVPASADAGSQAYRFLWVQGQAEGTLDEMNGLTFSNVSTGEFSTLFIEFVPIARLIIRYTAGNWTIVQVDKIIETRVAALAGASAGLTTVSVTPPLTGDGTVGDPIAIPAATASVNGYLTSADWSTFNGKQAAYTLLTTFGSLANASGFLKNNGSGVLSYDNTPQNTALWGNITGASAQAAPAGGWTGDHGAMAMGALTATTGTFTGLFSSTATGEHNFGDSSGAASTYVRIRAAAGQNRGLVFSSGTARRWLLYANSVAETGSDAGSNLQLISYTDAGVFLDSVANITRAAGGAITFNSARPVSMGALTATTGTFSGAFGCNGATAQTKATVNAASTDLATVIALCNQLRAALVANGICV